MTVSILLDVIIVFITVITLIISVRRGFVRSIQSILIFFASILIALAFRESVIRLIQNTSLPDTVQKGVESTVESILPDSTSSLSDWYDDNESVAQALNTIGISEDEYKSWANNIASSSKDSLENSLVDFIVPQVTNILFNVISVVGLFLLSFLILKIAALILNKLIQSISLLRSANTFLGFLSGVLLSVIRVLLFCSVVHALLKVSFFTELPVVSSIHEEETYIFRWIVSLPFLQFLF